MRIAHNNIIEGLILMNNELITIVDRVPRVRVEDARPHNNDGIERPYSLIPGQFFEGTHYITYPGIKTGVYIINTQGMVFNTKTGRQLFGHIAHNGYCSVSLKANDDSIRSYLLHRLVAYEFCDPPLDFASKIVNHVDTDKDHNYANNLEWITVAANIQHSIEFHKIENNCIINKRPIVTEEFVDYLCHQFMKGKNNSDIMNELGMEITSANHSLLRDIRSGNTWKQVTSKYTFNRSSKKYSYSNEEKDLMEKYVLQGKTDKEIFAIMNGREYVPSKDRLSSRYKTIYSIRTSAFLKKGKMLYVQ